MKCASITSWDQIVTHVDIYYSVLQLLGEKIKCIFDLLYIVKSYYRTTRHLLKTSAERERERERDLRCFIRSPGTLLSQVGLSTIIDCAVFFYVSHLTVLLYVTRKLWLFGFVSMVLIGCRARPNACMWCPMNDLLLALIDSCMLHLMWFFLN